MDRERDGQKSENSILLKKEETPKFKKKIWKILSI